MGMWRPGRALVAGVVAVVVGLGLSGCPSSSGSEPVCAQPTAGSADGGECDDVDTVTGR
ncbi:hypothetical protein [Actinoplanes ianthinogenes]|nr:hypothetical protein [Actinoplanes ianthinogenes]